jgi:hypothetical protein
MDGVLADMPKAESDDGAREDAKECTPRSAVPEVLKAQEDSPRKGFICPDCKHVAASPEELMVHYETHLVDHGALLKSKAKQKSGSDTSEEQESSDVQVQLLPCV